MQSPTPDPEPLLVSTREAARLLGLSTSLLEKLRHYRRPGPRFVRVGRAVRYAPSDLRAWAAARAESTE
jgi:predicted DNA-binding transcriptional regulator AlpA